MGSNKYAGKDVKGGWDTHGATMERKGREALEHWASDPAQRGSMQEGRYGIGEQRRESGVEFGFNPMDFKSISEALAKKQFKSDVLGQLGQTPNIHGSAETDIWDFSEPSAGTGGRRSDVYAKVDRDDIDDYWEHWRKGADMDIFEGLAKSGGISKQEIAGLDPGAKRWRRMEDPLMAEATDVYRGGLGGVMSGLGNIQTGSAAKRRKQLLEDYGQSVFDIRGKTSSARGKQSDKLASRIQKLFQS